MKPAQWGMWVLKPIWAYVNAKCDSRMPRNRSTILNVKSIHYPNNWKPLSEIEQNLFQELGSAVYWSDGYTMLIDLSLCTSPGSRQLSNARLIWLCACVRYWPGTGLVHLCQLPLFSAEASLYCRKAREKEKESAWRTMGRGKREERLPPFPSSHRPLCAFYLLLLLLLLLLLSLLLFL